MKYLAVVGLGILFALSACPAVGLWKIAWQDRKVPIGHPDYVGLFGGKRMVVLAALCCSLAAVCCILGIRWCLK